MPDPVAVGSVLFGADELVGKFVRSLYPDACFDHYTALGVIRQGTLIGGVIYHNQRGCDIETIAAFNQPNWALPGTLRLLFGYPFQQLGCTRITAIIARKNKRSRRVFEGLGFRLEGVMRRALDGKQDAMIYGILRDECRWLKGKQRNGVIQKRHSASTSAA